MVLVEDVSGQSESTPSSPNGQSSSSSSSPSSSSSSSTISSLSQFIANDKIAAVLLATRLFTIACTLLFVVPIFGYDPNTLYQKALMASAATSALKLHQRMANQPFRLNMEYFNKLMIEDSFHYLQYSLIFLSTFPITIVMMPVGAFALLHVTVYLKQILNLISSTPGSFGLIRRCLDAITAKDKDIMRFIAVNEIILGPTIIFMIFSGKCGIFVPFIFYRFICMRYMSRRNPYNRIMFYELRVTLDHYTSHARCPLIVRSLTQRLIGLVVRFAPAQAL